jgi:hypothetical protein
MSASPSSSVWHAPRRLLAGAAALVLAGGVAVAATGHAGRTRPVAERRPAATPTGGAPAPSATRAPRPSRSPATVVRSRPATTPLYPLPARPAYPHPCPPPPVPPGPPFKAPKPLVKSRDLPHAVAVSRHRHVDLGPVTGKGMWLTTWADTRLDVGTVVARARAAGLHQLWVRTGGSYQGWYGDRLLRRLLPAAHAAGLRVVAWDFPTLSDPLADVSRARAAITGTFAGQHIDAFSADIETIYEGTFDTPRRVKVYLSRVRAVAGSMPVVATVLRPTTYMLATYPYRAEAPYVDVFAPMVYWSCNEPAPPHARRCGRSRGCARCT